MIYSVPAVDGTCIVENAVLPQPRLNIDNSTSYSEPPLGSETEDKKGVVGKKPGSIKKNLKKIPVKKKKAVKAVTEKKLKAPPKTKSPQKAKAPTIPKSQMVPK